jgi:hypothetical protein
MWICGYINDYSIHDIAALKDALLASAVDGMQAEKDRQGWTSRHMDNLRLWARKSHRIGFHP